MPIFAPPPSVQEAVSGANIQPTLGAGLDAHVRALRNEQANTRNLFAQIASQVPGLHEYLMANHPDIVAELAGPPRIFGGTAKVPLNERIADAMHQFATLPPPTEASLTGEQSVGVNKSAVDFLGGPDRIRRMALGNPERVQAAIEEYRRGLTALDGKVAAAHLRQAAQLAGAPISDDAAKFADTIEYITPVAEMLGLRTPEEKVNYALYLASGRDTPGQMALKQARDDADLIGKRLANERAGIDIESARIAQKKAAAGATLSDTITTELGDWNLAGKTAIELLDKIDSITAANGTPPTGAKDFLDIVSPAAARKWKQDIAYISALSDSLFAPIRNKIVGGAISAPEFEVIKRITPTLGAGTSVEQLRAAYIALIKRAAGLTDERVAAFASIPDHNEAQRVYFETRAVPLHERVAREEAAMGAAGGGEAAKKKRLEIHLGGGGIKVVRPTGGGGAD